jgi:hypothetical protein
LGSIRHIDVCGIELTESWRYLPSACIASPLILSFIEGAALALSQAWLCTLEHLAVLLFDVHLVL